MSPAVSRPNEDRDGAGEAASRRCLVTGEIRPKTALLRCVIGPDSAVVADVAGRLPGRGLWLTARRDIVARAVAQRLFARAARAPVIVEDGFADRVEALLAQRCVELLGLARRAGQAAAGFVKVRQALEAGKIAVLLAASDGAADGRAKLRALAPGLPLVEGLTSGELGLAFGREQVVHAALAKGRLAESLAVEAQRLAGFRGVAPDA